MRTLCILTLLVHTACRGNDAATPPTDQDRTLDWQSCHGAFECATLEVPLDYQEPTLGTAVLRVIRHPASGERRGSLLAIAGGPGSSGVAGVVDQAPAIDALLGGAMDIVGFDARGIEDSTPALVCGDNAAVDAIVALDTSPDTPAERAALDAAASAWVADCIARTPAALLPRVDSSRVAEDIEQLRIALGESQLNLVASSYGARAAARYAALYPDRVRALVMDSPGGPFVDVEAAIRAQAAGYQDALERFFAWCAAGCDGDANCFHVGDTTAEVRTAFVAARDEMEALALGRRADRALTTLLVSADFATLSRALLALEGGDADALLAAYPPAQTKPDGTYWNFLAARAAIWNADHLTPADFSSADFDAIMTDLAAGAAPEAAPFVGSESPNWLLGHWSIAPATPPAPYQAAAAPPFLILTGSHDPESRLADVMAFRDALGNGSYVVVREADGHLQINDPCMFDVAVSYVEDPETAPTITECP